MTIYEFFIFNTLLPEMATFSSKDFTAAKIKSFEASIAIINNFVLSAKTQLGS